MTSPNSIKHFSISLNMTCIYTRSQIECVNVILSVTLIHCKRIITIQINSIFIRKLQIKPKLSNHIKLGILCLLVKCRVTSIQNRFLTQRFFMTKKAEKSNFQVPEHKMQYNFRLATFPRSFPCLLGITKEFEQTFTLLRNLIR